MTAADRLARAAIDERRYNDQLANVLPAVARVLSHHFGAKAAAKAAAVIESLNAVNLALVTPKGLGPAAAAVLSQRGPASPLPLDLEVRLMYLSAIRDNRAELVNAARYAAVRAARPATRLGASLR